ncbi:MAG: hypothetical protein Q8P49_01525 [Candidatus Liptonbacteria bacterium]|nr:hypothetical protein [Candidatus Liptonbacteria bacterium]
MLVVGILFLVALVLCLDGFSLAPGRGHDCTNDRDCEVCRINAMYP